MSPATEAPSLRWVVLASLLALGLRCYALGANSLWMDEVATLQVARHSLGTIPEAALRQNAFEPPLYFWLVHLVTGLAGWSEAALRGLSAVAGAAAVPLLWWLVRELDGSVLAADLAAGLAAVNPLLLWYAQEARPYALLCALGLASLVSLALALRRDRRRYWVGYAGFGALALLSHAVAVVFPAIAALWVVLTRQPRRVLPRFLLATAGMLLATAPFLVALGRSVAGADGTGSPARPLTGLEIPYTLFTFVAGYSLGPAVREIQDWGWAAGVRAHPGQTAVVAAALAVWVLLVWRLRARPAGWLAILLALPVLAAFAGSVITAKAYNVRYTIPAVTGFVGLLGLGLAGLSPRGRTAALAAFVGVSLWADIQWFTASRYWKEDSRGAVACLSAALPAEARVAVAPGYMASVLNHYRDRAGARFQVVGIRDVRDLDPVNPPDALLLTRLHHVGDAEALARAFGAKAAAGEVTEAGVPGYRLLLRRSGAETSPRRCGEGA